VQDGYPKIMKVCLDLIQARGGVDDLVDLWEDEWVLGTSPIEASVVDTYSLRLVFLQHQDWVCWDS
jgi:hypothetical protein